MNRRVLIAGLAVVLPVLAILIANLGRDPHRIDTKMKGRPAPEFALRALGSTEPVSLRSLRGTPVVVNFWATWCVPCLSEHPVLLAQSEQWKDVRFLGVVYDDTEPTVQRFLDQHGGSYPVLFDQDGRTAIAYGVTGVPETFFIDRNGMIVDKVNLPLDADTLRAKLADLVKR